MHTYDNVDRRQIIYLDSESTEVQLISGDNYKKLVQENDVIYNIYNGDNTILEMKYVFGNDDIVKVLCNDNKELEYEYNENGQIISISENNNKIWGYEYNLVGQMTVAYNYENNYMEKYAYDMYNNVISVKKYVYDGEQGELLQQDNYQYDSKLNADRVTSFNGAYISYDEIGNPLTYYDGKQFSWSGRNLDSIQTAEEYIEYAYDKNGLRVQKNVEGNEINYYYEGEDIIVEASDEYSIWYIYDDTTNILGFTYDGADYYYIKNASQDVIAIADDEGNYVCGYEYDPWGNIISVDGDEKIASVNPIRYRSYYYDDESGFYYLKTRYYDPEMRRFISMDDVCDVAYEMVDPNLYAYCCNDPVNLYDPEGRAYLYVDIFTVKEFEKETKELLIEELIDESYSTVSYDITVGDTRQSFVEWWEKLDGTDIAIINSHGSPTEIIGVNYISYTELEDIKKVDVKFLVLLGCNCGHFSFWGRGICSRLANRITGIVMASDGTVNANSKNNFLERFIYYESVADNTFKSYLGNVVRDNFGWCLFSGLLGKKTIIDKYRIDADIILKYYQKREFITFK